MSNKNVTPPPRRHYVQRRRAENQSETRRRITEAAVELHGTIGPARTTISAIAELAGVRRATVYRHFPDERSLYLACSGHFADANPLPDPTAWWTIDDPEQRLRVALGDLYSWYQRVEPMLANVLRDRDAVPVVAEIGARRAEYLATVADGLARGWGARGRRARLLRAALAVALDFHVWQTLRLRDLERSEAVELMVILTRNAAAPPADRSKPSARE